MQWVQLHPHFSRKAVLHPQKSTETREYSGISSQINGTWFFAPTTFNLLIRHIRKILRLSIKLKYYLKRINHVSHNFTRQGKQINHPRSSPKFLNKYEYIMKIEWSRNKLFVKGISYCWPTKFDFSALACSMTQLFLKLW